MIEPRGSIRVHHSVYPSTLSLYSAEWLSGCVVAAVWKAAGPVSSVQCGTMRESATRTTTGVLRQFAAAFSGIHKQYIMYSEQVKPFVSTSVFMKTLTNRQHFLSMC